MLRLFIYLGSAFLLALTGIAAYIYAGAAGFAREQGERELRLFHEQAALRMSQTVAAIDSAVQALAAEPAAQRFASGPSVREAQEERSLRAELDALIQRTLPKLPGESELCLERLEGGRICSPSVERPDSRPLASREVPVPARGERLLYPAEEPAGQTVWIAAQPIADLRSGVVTGTVILSFDGSRLWKPSAAEKEYVKRHRVFDRDGNIVFRLQEQEAVPSFSLAEEGGEFVRAEHGWLISQRRLDIPWVSWYSRVEVPAETSRFGQELLLRTLALVLAVIAVWLGVSGLLYRRYWLQPLTTLQTLMKRAERGDWKAYWLHKGGPLGGLGDSYNQMLNRLEELIRQVKREEALKKEAEMEALKYQLNPHFLYNTLNTIKWVAKMHRTPQIAEAVTALVRLLQASLGKKGDFITVKEELGLISDYMEIQRFRYGDHIRLECAVERGAEQCLIPCMLLQPLVENAIIHGIEPAKKEGLISVRVSLEPERELLICEVQDNGVGMSEFERGHGNEAASVSAGGSRGGGRERMSGIGLAHIREKIRLYYGGAYHMHTVGKPGEGTTVRLTLPAHRNEGADAG